MLDVALSEPQQSPSVTFLGAPAAFLESTAISVVSNPPDAPALLQFAHSSESSALLAIVKRVVGSEILAFFPGVHGAV